MQKKKLKSAFTLIELLVVIAIVGILSGFIFVSMNSAITASKDAKRKADIAAIAKAVSMYAAQNSVYPGGTGTTPDTYPCTIGGGTTRCTNLEANLASYLTTIPKDPNGTTFYTYSYSSTLPSFTLQSILSSGYSYQFDSATAGFSTNNFVSPCVSGGGLTCAEVLDGSYVVDTYTYSAGPGSTTWQVPMGVTSVAILVVAGGGGGGSSQSAGGGGGGGGAGGLIYNAAYTNSISGGNNITVTVGSGGAGGTINANASGANGTNSVFGITNIQTAIGGGGGDKGTDGSGSGSAGGSGGGGGYNTRPGGAGTAGQGNAGAAGTTPGGGGGGAGAVGSGVNGGIGSQYSMITGVPTYYAGGGGGGGTPGTGGTGGGGAGGAGGVVGVIGTPGTGGGGGGTYAAGAAGGAGGSGIVIIRYLHP